MRTSVPADKDEERRSPGLAPVVNDDLLLVTEPRCASGGGQSPRESGERHAGRMSAGVRAQAGSNSCMRGHGVAIDEEHGRRAVDGEVGIDVEVWRSSAFRLSCREALHALGAKTPEQATIPSSGGAPPEPRASSPGRQRPAIGHRKYPYFRALRCSVVQHRAARALTG